MMKNKKRKVLLGVLIVLVLCIGLFMKNKVNNLNNTSLNEESVTKELNGNLIGAYIQEGEEYIQTDDIPSSGYEFNGEKSYCKIGEDIQEGTTLSYDMDTQTLTVSPITKEGMKCYLYFDEKASAGDTILASENAPTNSTTDWTNGGKGITYYYTGNPNNWVEFAGFYWRIIRINGDGTIRMIYKGTDYNFMNNDDIVAESVFNGSHYDNMYVGYMYQSGQIQGLQQSSTVKSVLDSWYVNNIAYKGYGKYIDGNAGFCGDRRTSSVSGTETIFITYQPSTRVDNNSPSLVCEDIDIYTTSGSSVGNKVLTQPIGLISTDEAMFAGSSFSNYLNIDEDYWTMSPAGYPDAAVFYIDDYGNLYGTYTDNKLGVCPVINLRADVEIIGEGTTSDPFKVVGAS